jgi:hypothetical protein
MNTLLNSARPWTRLFAPLLALLLLPGCSGKDAGPTGRVSGTLQLKGQPLSPGHVVVFMEPKSGKVVYGATDAAGKFRIDSSNKGNLPVGRYEVTIRPPKEVGADNGDAAAAMDKPSPAKKANPQFAFPEKYAETASSGLAYEVKAGENDFTIELKE